MTVSRDSRIQDLADTLRKMSEDVGDNAVWRVEVSTDSERYSHVLPTTWKELDDRGLVKFFFHNTYQLTYYGWRKGIELRQLHFKLAAVLKAEVKGRCEDGYLHVSQVAERTGLTEDFVYNAIESELLDYCFKMKGAHFDGPNSCEIVVPIDFGMEPL